MVFRDAVANPRQAPQGATLGDEVFHLAHCLLEADH